MDGETTTEFTYILNATETSDGGFMMAGQFDSSPSSLYPSGIQTAIAIRTDEYGCINPGCQVGVQEYEKQSLEVYPNPTEGNFIIKLPDYSKYSVQIFNSLGELVFQDLQIRGAKYSVTLSSENKGVYFVHLLSENGDLYSSKIIKK